MYYHEALSVGIAVTYGEFLPGIHTQRLVRRWVESYAMHDNVQFLRLIRMSFQEQYGEWCKHHASPPSEWDF